jgi:putative endonuclease
VLRSRKPALSEVEETCISICAIEKTYAIYILASRSLNFYVGVTSNPHRRVWGHKNHSFGGFTAQYKIDRLVYYETFDDIGKAILREKQLKGWIRAKKIALIKSQNPTWLDLSETWYENCRSFDSARRSRGEQQASLRMTDRLTTSS